MPVLTWDPSEKEWQDEVIKAATLGGWAYYHTHDSRRSVAGFPDLVLVRVPELVVAELKTVKGRIRPEQQEWLDGLAACGIETHLWRPGQLDEVYDRLVIRHRRASRNANGPSV